MSLGKQLTEARRSLKLTTSEVAAATRVKVQIIEALEQDDFSKIAAPIYGKGFIRLYAEHVRIDPAPLITEYMQAVGAPESPPLDLGTETSQPAPKKPEPAPEPEKQAPPAQPEEADDEYDLFNSPEEEADGEKVEEVIVATTDEAEKVRKTVTELRRGEQPEPEAEPAVAESDWTAGGHDPDSTDEAVIPAGERISKWTAALSARIAEITKGLDLSKDPWKLAPVALGIILVIAFVISGLSRCARDPEARNAGHDPGSRDTLHVAVDLPEPYFE
jgi:transcriptional regulator with XRE-family HTH domain